jgi:hypothetical protein
MAAVGVQTGKSLAWLAGRCHARSPADARGGQVKAYVPFSRIRPSPGFNFRNVPHDLITALFRSYR